MPIAVQWLLFGLGFGFVLAAPFIAIRRYSYRVLLSTAVPVIIYSFLMLCWCLIGACIHPGPSWDPFAAFGIVLGGLCAAHLKDLCTYVKRRIQGSQ
jgi:hypothetical protein